MTIRRWAALAVVLLIGSSSAAVAQTPEATPIVAMSPYIAGDAFGLIPAGQEKSLSVALFSVIDAERGDVALVVRNDTDADALAVRVIATAHTSDGALYAVSETTYITPTRIIPGSVGIGVVTFRGTTLTDDLTFEFSISEDEYADLIEENAPSLTIKSVNKIESRIVGEATNESQFESSFVAVRGLCFTDGAPSESLLDITPDSTASPGETIPFQIELRGPCDSFLVTVG